MTGRGLPDNPNPHTRRWRFSLADVDVENVEMFISEISDFLWMGIFGFIGSRVTLTRHPLNCSFFWFIITKLDDHVFWEMVVPQIEA